MKVKSESKVAQSCPTLSDPMDCSLPGSSVHGIFQARVLKWGATAFSKLYIKRDINLSVCMCVCVCVCVCTHIYINIWDSQVELVVKNCLPMQEI